MIWPGGRSAPPSRWRRRPARAVRSWRRRPRTAFVDAMSLAFLVAAGVALGAAVMVARFMPGRHDSRGIQGAGIGGAAPPPPGRRRRRPRPRPPRPPRRSSTGLHRRPRRSWRSCAGRRSRSRRRTPRRSTRNTHRAGTDQSAWAAATATFSAGVAAALTRADTSRLAWRSTTWIRNPPKAPIAPAMPMTAAARRLNSTAVARGSSPLAAASRRPRTAKIDGIIL